MVDQLVCWWAFNMQLSLNIKLVLVEQVVNQLWFQYPRCWKQAVVGSLLHPSTLQTSCAWPGSRNQISQVKNSRRGFNTRLHHVHHSVHQKEGQYDIAEMADNWIMLLKKIPSICICMGKKLANLGWLTVFGKQPHEIQGRKEVNARFIGFLNKNLLTW
jgi:hypothetical protein